MNELENIKDDIQNIAEAILSVINIDVTIVDDKFIRIAGTGKYIDKIGDKCISFLFSDEQRMEL